MIGDRHLDQPVVTGKMLSTAVQHTSVALDVDVLHDERFPRFLQFEAGPRLVLSLFCDTDVVYRWWAHHHIPSRLHPSNIHRLSHRNSLPPRRLSRIQYHSQFLNFPQLGKILLVEPPFLLDRVDHRAALGVVGLAEHQVRAVVEHLRGASGVAADGDLLVSITPTLMHGLDH